MEELNISSAINLSSGAALMNVSRLQSDQEQAQRAQQPGKRSEDGSEGVSVQISAEALSRTGLQSEATSQVSGGVQAAASAPNPDERVEGMESYTQNSAEGLNERDMRTAAAEQEYQAAGAANITSQNSSSSPAAVGGAQQGEQGSAQDQLQDDGVTVSQSDGAFSAGQKPQATQMLEKQNQEAEAAEKEAAASNGPPKQVVASSLEQKMATNSYQGMSGKSTNIANVLMSA